MKYTLSLYLILAFDFIVIALKVRHANRHKSNSAAVPHKQGHAHIKQATPTGHFLNTDEPVCREGVRG